MAALKTCPGPPKSRWTCALSHVVGGTAALHFLTFEAHAEASLWVLTLWTRAVAPYQFKDQTSCAHLFSLNGISFPALFLLPSISPRQAQYSPNLTSA